MILGTQSTNQEGKNLGKSANLRDFNRFFGISPLKASKESAFSYVGPNRADESSRTKPSFATVTGWGVDRTHIHHIGKIFQGSLNYPVGGNQTSSKVAGNLEGFPM